MTIFGYTRVSSIEQTQYERSSLDDQEIKIRGAVMMRGENNPVIFSDPAVSGSVALKNRPAGKRMIASLAPGDIVVASKMDRLFRSSLDAISTAEEFRRRGIGIILVDIGLEPVTENGSAKLFFSMLAAFAEFERERIAERMADGRKGKKARGGHIGGDAPYGWRKVGTGREARLVEDENEQRTIALAARLRAEGSSYDKVARALEVRGHLNRLGTRFKSVQIQRMMATTSGEHSHATQVHSAPRALPDGKPEA